MPRGARFVFENAFYHVFNRGINKQEIFHDDADYQFFLRKVLKLKDKFDHSIYALCLMPNHFHISIQTRKIPISKIMSSLTTSYSMYFNKKYIHFGSVFQNRFKSILVQNDAYFLEVSRYIYLNPIKANIVADPLDYPYSTLQEALGIKPITYLDDDITRLIGDSFVSKEEYRKFVYQGLEEDLSEIEKLLEKDETVLGDRIFSRLAQTKYLRRKNRSI